MRIFLDTNVLVSGLMGRGLCKDLLSRVVIEHTVVLGAPVRDELRRVLLTKFRIPEVLWREMDGRLAEFEQAAASVITPAVAISDASDIPIVACAIAARVDVFVTGDQVLLDIGNAGSMPIKSPRALWLMLGEKKDG